MASRLQDVILRGTRASQPAATTLAIGTLYFVSDESVIERSNGTIWQTYSGGGSPSSSSLVGSLGFVPLDGEDGLDSLIPGPAGVPGATGATGATGASGAASSIPKPGLTSPVYRFMAWMKNDTTNNSTMTAVGAAALVTTGGSSTVDTDGIWANPTSASGSSCRASANVPVTTIDLLPKVIFRFRTPNVITTERIMIGLNEYVSSGVDTDTPTNTQRGIYVCYSTTVDGTAFWRLLCRNTAGNSSRIDSTVAIAASTIYTITITVNSLSSVDVTINGTTTNLTSNIPNTACPLGPEMLASALSAHTTYLGISSIYLETI